MAPKRKSGHDDDALQPESPPKRMSIRLANAQQPESLLRPLPEVKLESTNDNGDVDLPDINLLDHAKIALAGPARRGRKIGSGQGEKRKDTDTYSTNVNTVKSMARKAGMNEFQADIQRAKNRDNVWVSRQIAAWKKTPAYTSLPSSDRDTAEREKRGQLRLQRSVEYGNDENAVMAAIMDRFGAELSNQLSTWQDKVTADLLAQGVPLDSEAYWLDEESDTEEGEMLQRSSQPKGALALILSHGKANEGFKQAADRRERKNIIDRAAWVGTRAKFMGQLTNFMAKIKFLNWLGAFTRDGQIKPRWVKFLKENPDMQVKGFFSKTEKKYLRMFWALKEGDEWVELPGPVSMWPDDPEWYAANGLEFNDATREEVIKALEQLEEDEAPEGWNESLHGFGQNSQEVMWREKA